MEGGYRAVPQRLFANWEMDRASTSVVQRVFTLTISRLSIFPFPSQIRSFVITAKLEGYKRSLRSNEIIVPEGHGRLDIPLDISFTIQYPHFLKYKRNVMQIHIQRKRKYKNRPIPGGFKSIAVGAMDLTSMLQSGSTTGNGGRNTELPLYAYDTPKNTSTAELHSIGRLLLQSSATSPLENEGRASNGLPKDKVELSSDTEISEDDDSEGGLPSGRSEGPSQPPHSNVGLRDSQRRRKRDQRKNIKQRLVNLLKKFRVPEEEVEAAASSVGREPTAKELQALFDELDDLSDSGNEGVPPDEISIVSNPRPALRPYFTSREHLPLTAIDDRGSESEGEDLGWSSETEGGAVAPADPSTSTTLTQITGGNTVTHSHTAHSLSAREKDKVARNGSLSDQLYAILSHESTGGIQGTSGGRSECVWLCQVSDENILSSLSSAHSSAQDRGTSPSLHLITTNSLKDVRTAIQQIVAKIQNFCNSNSTAPPLTWVGVLGPDRLVSQVLRAYVDALAHKSSSSWLQYLRFALVVPPSSLVGRLIAGLDSALEQLSRDVWERWTELEGNEQREVAERMAVWTGGGKGHTGSLLNLPIGEALLQLSSNSDKEKEYSDNSRLFVPFLSEVRVGYEDDDPSTTSTTNSPRSIDPSSLHPSSIPPEALYLPPNTPIGQSSPPVSPQTKGCCNETHEMQVEYWMGSSPSEYVAPMVQGGQQTTPQGKKDNSKGSMKCHFRTLVVSRHSVTSLLSLSFVKEKRKEKMLQKLGMKNKQRSDLESSPVQIPNISRLLCSAQGKHTVTVVVDGCPYSDVRFFQTSSQWQTHVKHFPIGLLTSGLTGL